MSSSPFDGSGPTCNLDIINASAIILLRLELQSDPQVQFSYETGVVSGLRKLRRFVTSTTEQEVIDKLSEGMERVQNHPESDEAVRIFQEIDTLAQTCFQQANNSTSTTHTVTSCVLMTRIRLLCALFTQGFFFPAHHSHNHHKKDSPPDAGKRDSKNHLPPHLMPVKSKDPVSASMAKGANLLDELIENTKIQKAISAEAAYHHAVASGSGRVTAGPGSRGGSPRTTPGAENSTAPPTANVFSMLVSTLASAASASAGGSHSKAERKTRFILFAELADLRYSYFSLILSLPRSRYPVISDSDNWTNCKPLKLRDVTNNHIITSLLSIGDYLYAGDDHGYLYQWNTHTYELVLKEKISGTGSISGVGIVSGKGRVDMLLSSYNGERLFACSYASTTGMSGIAVIDLTPSLTVRTVLLEKNGANLITAKLVGTGKGQRIVGIYTGHRILVWDVDTLSKQHDITTPSTTEIVCCESLAPTPTESVIMIGCDDGSIHLYPFSTDGGVGDSVPLSGHTKAIRALYVHTGTREVPHQGHLREERIAWLFSASVDGTVRIWDLSNTSSATKCLLHTVTLESGDYGCSLGVIQRSLVIGSQKGKIYVYDLHHPNTVNMPLSWSSHVLHSSADILITDEHTGMAIIAHQAIREDSLSSSTITSTTTTSTTTNEVFAVLDIATKTTEFLSLEHYSVECGYYYRGRFVYSAGGNKTRVKLL